MANQQYKSYDTDGTLLEATYNFVVYSDSDEIFSCVRTIKKGGNKKSGWISTQIQDMQRNLKYRFMKTASELKKVRTITVSYEQL